MKQAVITFALGEAARQTIVVNEKQSWFTVGRSPDCTIQLGETTVSSLHGCFFWEQNQLFYADQNSTNGSFVNGRRISATVALWDGAVVTLGGMHSQNKFIVAFPEAAQNGPPVPAGASFPQNKSVLFAGRDFSCDIILPLHNVSRFHAKLYARNGRYYIEDNNSTNGTFVNGIRIVKPCAVTPRDTVYIGGIRLRLQDGTLVVADDQQGLSVQLYDVYRDVPDKNGRKTILEHISFCVEPNEFVAVIGGSGAGKSTLINILCGKTTDYGGSFTYNHATEMDSRSIFKSAIGYAPQNDILYHDLTLSQMLYYSAKLKMPQDTGPEEYKERVIQVIQTVALSGSENTLVKNLSGGQKKRASIAVELLSDPKLFFFDEPTSGLDPATERTLMRMLKGMTRDNKTIIAVTHITQNLDLCDKIIVLGAGGKLCFFGAPKDACVFFGVKDIVDIYDIINKNPSVWQQKFAGKNPHNRSGTGVSAAGQQSQKSKKDVKAGYNSGWSQFVILCARYLRLLSGDPKRLLLLILQAPVLGVLLMLVSDSALSDSTVFAYSSTAKSMLFSLTCAVFWVGMLNSIQEICKERDIFERERMSTVRLLPYISSKLAVIGILCALQSLVMLLVVRLFSGSFPANDFGFQPFWAFYLTTCLTTLSAACLGLAISSLSPNPDRAMAIAPIVLLPQIIFSGVVFELTGFLSFISGIIPCKHSMQGFGILTNFNALPTSSETATQSIDALYSATDVARLYGSWIGLLVCSLICIAIFVMAVKTKKS
ncbi:MAG: FHA domain-containing protein [Oscillospiraceae bacterium]|nr:FHA domain-containing protein [Oscillospiraceae bacterium]